MEALGRKFDVSKTMSAIYNTIFRFKRSQKEGERSHRIVDTANTQRRNLWCYYDSPNMHFVEFHNCMSHRERLTEVTQNSLCVLQYLTCKSFKSPRQQQQHFLLPVRCSPLQWCALRPSLAVGGDRELRWADCLCFLRLRIIFLPGASTFN